MGAVIEAVATARGAAGRRHRGSVTLAADAAQATLRRAGRTAGEIDVLINAGVYNDGFVAEPADAAFVQRRIGANPDPASADGRVTLSFDINNGGCGLLTAIQVLDGFLTSGTSRLGLVVVSDTTYARGFVRGEFPFAAAGGAVLLRGGPANEGFVAFASETFPEHVEAFASRVEWQESVTRGKHLPPGPRSLLTIEESGDYLRASLDCAARVVKPFLEEIGLAPADVDLVVPSQYPPGFAAGIGARAGIADARVVDVPATSAHLHTAGPAAALEVAVEDGRLARARDILFVTVGSGLTVFTALYRNGAVR
jgi:3-oxoacyl-[acyl-carrier-protein] synthase-3